MQPCTAAVIGQRGRGRGSRQGHAARRDPDLVLGPCLSTATPGILVFVFVFVSIFIEKQLKTMLRGQWPVSAALQSCLCHQ